MIRTPRLLAVALACLIAGAATGQVPVGAVPPPPPPPAPPVGGMPEDPARGRSDAPVPAAPIPPATREPVAFAAATLGTLDKISGRVRRIDLGVGETAKAGALSLTLRACQARPEDDLPDSAAFVEVIEARGEDATMLRLFTGWMFASALAVSAIDHPVYDVWLVACRTSARGSSR